MKQITTFLLLFFTLTISAQPKKLTIIHTNDIQSRLLGFSPNQDYTPLTLNDDKTVGGIARMATVIREHKAVAPEQTLVLDGGDFMMGTLFQTLCSSVSPELRIMQAIGYDAVGIGNHEFDFRSKGLADIINTAKKAGDIPPLLLSNIVFSKTEKEDDSLEALFDNGTIERYRIIEKNGLNIGFFGLMGIDAAEVSPYAYPASFTDPIESAKAMVAFLKNEKKVDLVICLSHCGVERDVATGSFLGEDIDIATAVPEIDLVIGGHSHTVIPEPVMVNGTPVVQAGSECSHVGVMEISMENKQLKMDAYKLVTIDDSIETAPDINNMLSDYKKAIDSLVLSEYNLKFDEVLVETDFDLILDASDWSKCNLGNFTADAVRWGIRQHYKQDIPVITLTAAGLIRDKILKGEKGFQQASDLFRVMPLGIGSVDDSPGYPLTLAHITKAELKNVLEILSFAYTQKGMSYYPFLSGVRFKYNPNRIPLDRVYDIELGDAASGYKLLDDSVDLIALGVNAYVLKNIGLIENMSSGLLSVQPKDMSAKLFKNLDKDALMDKDPMINGVQEIKEWGTLLGFARQFKDTNGNGIPDIPDRYRTAEARMIEQASWNPSLMYRDAGWMMWTATGVVAFLVLITGLGIKRFL